VCATKCQIEAIHEGGSVASAAVRLRSEISRRSFSLSLPKHKSAHKIAADRRMREREVCQNNEVQSGALKCSLTQTSGKKQKEVQEEEETSLPEFHHLTHTRDN